jgi:hypothetical protein
MRTHLICAVFFLSLMGAASTLSCNYCWKTQLDITYVQTVNKNLQCDNENLKSRIGKVEGENLDSRIRESPLQGRVTKLESDKKVLKDVYRFLKSDNQVLERRVDTLMKERDMSIRSALRRQIAINLEYEYKMDLLNISAADDKDVLELKRDGNFSKFAVLGLRVERAKKIAERSSSPEALKNVTAKWFSEHSERLFKDTMFVLKAFSTEAHPTIYKEEPVDADTAEELVKDIEMTDPSLVEVAVFYVRRLKDIRRNQPNCGFLRA